MNKAINTVLGVTMCVLGCAYMPGFFDTINTACEVVVFATVWKDVRVDIPAWPAQVALIGYTVIGISMLVSGKD